MGKSLTWLSDAEWARIEPLLPSGRCGARRVDDRRVISGIVHMLRIEAARSLRSAAGRPRIRLDSLANILSRKPGEFGPFQVQFFAGGPSLLVATG